MLFHVTWETYPTVVLDDDKRVREAVGPQLGRLMESNKVREAGVLGGKRGASSSSTSTRPKRSTSYLGPRCSPTASWRRTPLRP
jgi:predicted oxidoreductase